MRVTCVMAGIWQTRVNADKNTDTKEKRAVHVFKKNLITEARYIKLNKKSSDSADGQIDGNSESVMSDILCLQLPACENVAVKGTSLFCDLLWAIWKSLFWLWDVKMSDFQYFLTFHRQNNQIIIKTH